MGKGSSVREKHLREGGEAGGELSNEGFGGVLSQPDPGGSSGGRKALESWCCPEARGLLFCRLFLSLYALALGSSPGETRGLCWRFSEGIAGSSEQLGDGCICGQAGMAPPQHLPCPSPHKGRL